MTFWEAVVWAVETGKPFWSPQSLRGHYYFYDAATKQLLYKTAWKDEPNRVQWWNTAFETIYEEYTDGKEVAGPIAPELQSAAQPARKGQRPAL